MSNIRILLVDDHAIVREGYKALINGQPTLDVIAEASSGEEAYVLYQQLQPDLVLLDLSLPGQSGLATLVKIKQNNTNARVLIFSMHQNSAFALKALKAGSRGYITKSSTPDELLKAINDVMHGKVALSSDIAHLLAVRQVVGDNSPTEKLTIREFEIFRMLVEGATKVQIAETLNISHKTVSNSHYIIKKKLDVQTDLELFRVALDMNLIDQENAK
jgi:two-component system invasion response regulator UvrY